MKDIVFITLLLWFCAVPEVFSTTSKSSALKIRIREPLGIKTLKRTGTVKQQSTGPPTGWWLYANGFDNSSKKLEKKLSSTFIIGKADSRAILEDFIENHRLRSYMTP